MKKCLFFLLLFISACKQLSESDIVNILNTQTAISANGSMMCQTVAEATERGGRLCYYIYPYAQSGIGSSAIAFAVQQNTDGSVAEIYIVLTRNSYNNMIHIGGYIDGIDKASEFIEDSIRNDVEYKVGTEIEKKVTDYFTPEFYQKARELNKTRPGKSSFDKSPIDAVIREIKEELHWNINDKDFLSKHPIVVHDSKTNSQITKSHFTNIFILPMGIVDGYGNIIDKARGIYFDRFKAKGYDDIEVVYLFPLSKINIYESSAELPIDIFTVPEYYRAGIQNATPIILDYVLRKHNKTSLRHAIDVLNRRGIRIDEDENLLNGFSIKQIFEINRHNKRRRK